MLNKMKKEVRKHLKVFLRKLLICFIIKSVLEGRITIEEVYTIIDQITVAKQVRKREAERQRFIERENKRFQDVCARFQNRKNCKSVD
jgi:hypothetical protein